MADVLKYGESGKGLMEFRSAYHKVLDWLEMAGAAHDVDDIHFSISASVKEPKFGQDTLFDGGPKPGRRNGKVRQIRKAEEKPDERVD